jgi:Leucine-rich repeat (LRR) protein
MKYMIAGLFLFFSFVLKAQWLDETVPDADEIYRDLSDALANPDDVFHLRLKIKNGVIPDEIFALHNLEVLELKKGKIETLPEGFAQLKKLRKLDLSGNDIQWFPEVLLEMHWLQELRLGKNPLQRIPDDIHRMESLGVLDLWSTQVTRLPVSVSEMKNLTTLDLRMIEISREEQEYFQEQMPDVKFYFSEPCNCR